MRKIILILLLVLPAAVLADFDGKCPVCKKLDQKSSVYDEGCWCTLMNVWSYYDEEGIYHYEDPNYCDCNYRCSEGHHFTERKGELFYEMPEKVK